MATPRTLAFGDLLRRFRGITGMTQEELGEKAGLSAKGIGDLERGARQTPRRETVRLLADALGLAERDRALFEAAARQRRVVGGSYAGGLSSATDLPGERRATEATLVGRETEQRRLDRHVAGDGTPLLLFEGEPGIGKSRLLAEAAARARTDGWTVLTGGCHRRSGQELFAPILGLLERHLTRQPAAERRLHLRGCAWLARLLPELAETLPPPTYAVAISAEHERRLMFAAVARYLDNVAGPAGTMLVLDDLQWAGPDALDLLAFLLRETSGARRVRVVGAYRHTEVHAQDPLGMFLADLARENLASLAPLAPLATEEAARLLDTLMTGATGDAALESSELRERLLQRTGGVPYFLVSYVQGLRSGALNDGDGGGSDLPWTVAETIRQRMAVLPSVSRELLDVAAVAGRTTPRGLLLAVGGVAGYDERALLDGIERACHGRLLVEAGASDYAFPHDLIRETVLSDLSAARREMLHRQIAEALEQGPAVPVTETLAYHYSRSGVPEKAASYLEAAGDRARTRFAYVEALNDYREAVEWLERLGRVEDAARVRDRVATILVILLRYDEAVATLEQAAQTYQARGDVEGLVRVVAQLGQAHAFRGTPQEGVARVEPLLKQSEALGLSRRGVTVLSAALARLFLVMGNYTGLLTLAERVVEYAREAADDAALAEAKYFNGWVLLHLGRCAEGVQSLVAASPLAQQVGDLRTHAISLANAAWGHSIMGEFDIAQSYLTQALSVAERYGDPAVAAQVITLRSDIAFRTGDWERAKADSELALGLIRNIGHSWCSMWPPFFLGQVGLARGEQVLAESLFQEALALDSRNGDVHVPRRVHLALAERDVLEAHPDRARDRLVPLLDRFDEPETMVTCLLPILAWARLDLGEAREAEALTEQALLRARTQRLRVPLVDALRIRALALARRDQWQPAMDTLEEAIELARGMPYPYAEAKALYVYGQLHQARGEPDQARERLDEALAILDRLGERLYREHIEEHIERALNPI